MIVLSGASLVLPDRVLSPGTLVIEDGRIAEIRSDAPSGGHAAFAFHGHYIVPGFIDVHVHGVDGVDTLDERRDGGAVAAIAARLPRYGVTAFCPTTVACDPPALRRVLDQVRRAREAPPSRAARVLPAHLESNFINPEYNGAQPVGCLRSPRAALGAEGQEAGRAGAERREGHDRRKRANSPPPTSSPRSSAPRRTSGSSRSRPSWTAESIWCAGWRRAAIASRSDTPPPPTTRRSPRLPPARGTPRTCSIACRRSATARPGSPAPCCRPTRSPRRSFVTASTFTRR